MDATGKDALQNGTCATAFALYNAKPEPMRTSDYLLSFVRALPLTLHDVLLTPSENQAFTDLLRHTILSIIVNHGGPAFTHFKPAVDPSASRTIVDCKIPIHTTKVFPLPTMEIDESTIVGNAEVVESMFSAIGLDMASETFTRTVKLIAGDQLSIARLRALTRNRAGHDSFANSYIWAVVIPGIFHYKMAVTHGFMELHYGRNTSPGNPGSLAFHNNLLDRKPIVLTSLPPFRESHNFIFVSLYAHVLCCLELVSGSEDLDGYAQNVSLKQLQDHCAEIVQRFADGNYPESQHPTQGDMVLENAILFLHNALLLRLLTNRVKLLNNWLVNPTGKANAWVKVDLLQEHFNFWIKTIYKAHGSNASWEWLAMISPCINVLCRLATEIHVERSTKHTTPSLNKDIRQLVMSLRQFHVYELQPGREIDDGTDHSGLVADSITLGLQRLSEPLEQFNRTFHKLQSRCTAAPLLGAPYATFGGTEAGDQAPSSSPSPGVSGEDRVAPPTGGAMEVDGSDSGEDSEDQFDDDSGEDLELPVFMSVETAEDIALDMDIEDMFILE
ncbi:hypothetical protein C8Q72DRAFT_877971 [Fomitopsis betulina]|nr:hypothetical protein C8Q72DRAFT_877971 [Fomitopsis betulina]